MITHRLENRFIGYAHISTRVLLTQLFTTYGNICDNGIRLNNTKMNISYNANIPIEVLFDKVEDSMDYVAAGNYPNMPE